MVSETLNNAFFSKILNGYIFRTTHRIIMIFSSKCRVKVIEQILNTFGTVEYSTGPMRTHKETTNSTAKFGSKVAELKAPKIAHETKNLNFFKVQDIDTPIQPRKKKHQINDISSLKAF